MTGPKPNLPSQAQPWGRWITDTESETSSALARLSQDSRNSGLSFKAQTENIAGQIAAIPSLAGITEFNVPAFDVSRPSFVGTFRVWDSPNFTINPPRNDTAYTASVIAVIRVSEVNLLFGRSYLRINGLDDSFSHENMQGADSSVLSIMGTRDLLPGEPLNIQFAVSGASVGTAKFRNCKLYAIFNGRIQ